MKSDRERITDLEWEVKSLRAQVAELTAAEGTDPPPDAPALIDALERMIDWAERGDYAASDENAVQFIAAWLPWTRRDTSSWRRRTQRTRND